ncbi:probable prolyl 4-hydroxylase 10 isoform X3 [Beta vulgaris subsp. vulgaris]|uniref:probable prolyl 4-hydroxylase 10 isoform X3 n=1 Tax=Beta vulgaris subsp. vulgaris TaxID=3555 RepID=UPI002036807E|nr:probable prolyl 4-hydroxylase 10 isoform X3 [Beta vulgaris subsp. vulgaris]XP_048495675.1 probable prolyl 4-hydroxylase 10 isoform X3 [Beta vulgaris subsp. vulgaris]XP_048495676.1 probable prolyl 4-hydroxylase 10 isoform X3 [Beta vulgaris subsp. vulgaris]
MSKDECEYLIKLASPHMEKLKVIDEKTGKNKDSRVRTSSGTFLPRGRDTIIRAVEQRIANFTFLPVEHGEGLQVLHYYEVGQKYEPHFDYFLEDYSTVTGDQRIATILMYLSDVEEGDETVFPSAKGNFSDVPYWNELSKCGQEGLAVKPKMGDALFFWSLKPDASLDPSSLHEFRRDWVEALKFYEDAYHALREYYQDIGPTYSQEKIDELGELWITYVGDQHEVQMMNEFSCCWVGS